MLSCVWQGVCSALTLILSPIVKVSPCLGVFETLSQSLPPMIGMAYDLSFFHGMLATHTHTKGVGTLRIPSLRCRPHDRGGCDVLAVDQKTRMGLPTDEC